MFYASTPDKTSQESSQALLKNDHGHQGYSLLFSDSVFFINCKSPKLNWGNWIQTILTQIGVL